MGDSLARSMDISVDILAQDYSVWSFPPCFPKQSPTMGKQSFVYLHRRLMPNPPAALYTVSASRATLQEDNDFRFDGKLCGTWCFTGDDLLIIQFRAGGGNGTLLNHIFIETTTKNCWRLVAASDPMYETLAGDPHNNKDTEIVLLMKVPEEIGLNDLTATAGVA